MEAKNMVLGELIHELVDTYEEWQMSIDSKKDSLKKMHDLCKEISARLEICTKRPEIRREEGEE